jgi:hypothetical protein
MTTPSPTTPRTRRADRRSSSEQETLAHAARIIADPALFARHFLCHNIWDTPAAIMRSVRDHQRTVVKACHASSKTFTAADVVLWWFARSPRAICLTTAPTWTQVEKLLWGEIHQTVRTGRIQFPRLYAAELRNDSGNFAIGLSTNEGVRFQGWHGEVLVVLDEALGVRPDIWDAIEGIRAGGDVHVLAIGNPNAGGGQFADAFGPRSGWMRFTIDGLDTPNTRGCGPTPHARLAEIVAHGDAGDVAYLNANVRPYLITRSYIYEKFGEWGESHPLWECKVRGLFPSHSEYAVFPLPWLERAEEHSPHAPTSGPVDVGIDVAGPGRAETAAYAVRGREYVDIVESSAWQLSDPRGPVLFWLARLRERYGVRRVKIDVAGIGHFFALAVEDAGYAVDRVNFGDAPRPEREPKFANCKADLYWTTRTLLEHGKLGGLVDKVTVAQGAPVLWHPTPMGLIEIESKEKLAARGVASPDRMEALIIAFAPDTPTAKPIQPSVSRRTLA